MTRKGKKRYRAKTTKQKTSEWCSKYIRLRDCINYCKEKGIDLSQFASYKDFPVQCCTCGVIRTFRMVDAGHFFGRGLGGGSGVYFDERNIHAQCKRCNGFEGGRPKEYEEFMLEKYDEKTIDELRLKHHLGRKYQDGELAALRQLFAEMFDSLLAEAL